MRDAGSGAGSGIVPPETTLGVQVRSGSDPITLGEWSAPYTAPGPLGPLSRYVRYRVRLERGESLRLRVPSPALAQARV